jgi:hypothetical protein
MKFRFVNWFSEPVLFEGTEFLLLYDCGNSRRRRIHDKDISDTRPFLWGRLPDTALGKTVKFRNKTYSIESIEATGGDSFVYFLGESRNAHKI